MCDKKQTEELYRPNDGANFLRAERGVAGLSVGVSGKGELKFEGYNSIQYTPLLVTMMLEMYAHPDRRSYYLYGTLPPAQLEVMELLRRAKIVVPALTPPVLGAAQMWEVNEDALRVYANAVCNISLPEQTWRI